MSRKTEQQINVLIQARTCLQSVQARSLNRGLLAPGTAPDRQLFPARPQHQPTKCGNLEFLEAIRVGVRQGIHR